MSTLNDRETSAPGFMMSWKPSNTISVAKAGIIAPATFFINETN